jgi:hypothetical protein
MTLQRLGTALLVAVTLLTANAGAQSKNELAGMIGRIFTNSQPVPNTSFFDNTVHFGKPLTFEVNYGHRMLGSDFAAITFEIPAVFSLNDELNYGINVVPESYRAFFITPSARFNLFAGNAVSPWVSVGGGIGHFSESSTLVFGGPNPGKTGTTTGVFQIGGGLDVRIWRAFSLRGEVRDFDSGVPQLNVNTGKSRQRNLFAGGGVVWHF